MADDVEVRVKEIRSNVHALSADRLHDALVEMVEKTISRSAEFLKLTVPKRSHLMEEHVEHDERAHQVADLIESRLGITPVVEADERHSGGKYKRSHYPLFVDEGTHSPIFAVSPAGMWNAPEGIFGRKEVRGQEGQHFMLQTLVFAEALIRTDEHIAAALREMAAEARGMSIAQRA